MARANTEWPAACGGLGAKPAAGSRSIERILDHACPVWQWRVDTVMADSVSVDQQASDVVGIE
jgi:hypothetical protein